MKLPKDIYTKRFQYWWPWNRTNWWWFHFDLGGDEWGNPSIMIGLPFLGMFVFFYEPYMDRESWYAYGISDNVVRYFSPDSLQYADVHGDTLGEYWHDRFDAVGAVPLSESTVKRIALKIGSTDDLGD